MTAKCKKGFKKVGKACVSTKSYKRVGKLADEVKILKIIIISSITSIGGWAIFNSLLGILKLQGINNWIMLVGGLIIIGATYKFGWKQVVN